MKKFAPVALAMLVAGCASAAKSPLVLKSESYDQIKNVRSIEYIYCLPDLINSRVIVKNETPQFTVYYEVNGINTVKRYFDIKDNGKGLDFADAVGRYCLFYAADDINKDKLYAANKTTQLNDFTVTYDGKKVMPRNSSDFKILQNEKNKLEKEIKRLNKNKLATPPPFPTLEYFSNKCF